MHVSSIQKYLLMNPQDACRTVIGNVNTLQVTHSDFTQRIYLNAVSRIALLEEVEMLKGKYGLRSTCYTQ